MSKLDDIISMNDKLYNWYAEGRWMPGYIRHNGAHYISNLLGIDYDDDTCVGLMNSKYPHVLASLNGPHGWAYLQIMIVKYNERKELNGKQQKSA